jgi:hypothetical protein
MDEVSIYVIDKEGCWEKNENNESFFIFLKE